MLGISRAYFGNIFGISFAYIEHTFGISWACLRHVLLLQHLAHLVCKFLAFFLKVCTKCSNFILNDHFQLPPPGYLASTSPLYTIYSTSSPESTVGKMTIGSSVSTIITIITIINHHHHYHHHHHHHHPHQQVGNILVSSPGGGNMKTAWDIQSISSLPSYESSVRSPVYVV